MLMQMSPPDENLTTAAANDAGIDAGAVCCCALRAAWTAATGQF